MLSSDLQKIKQEFAHGYLDGMAAFYVSMTMRLGKVYNLSMRKWTAGTSGGST